VVAAGEHDQAGAGLLDQPGHLGDRQVGRQVMHQPAVPRAGHAVAIRAGSPLSFPGPAWSTTAMPRGAALRLVGAGRR